MGSHFIDFSIMGFSINYIVRFQGSQKLLRGREGGSIAPPNRYLDRYLGRYINH